MKGAYHKDINCVFIEHSVECNKPSEYLLPVELPPEKTTSFSSPFSTLHRN